MKDLAGKVALVTGSSLGIGAAIAEALASEGCIVALTARGRPALEAVQARIVGSGGKAGVFPCDVGDSAAVKAMVDAIADDLGPVDILVNNAGAGTFKPLDRMTIDEAMLTVNLPFGAAVAACHAVVPGMIARGSGHIVNLTSPAGYLPLPYMVPYTASRHAMVGLSLSLREELADHGIGVSLLCPAQVNTGYFERNDANMDWYPKISKNFPILEPDEVGREAVKVIKKNTRERIFPSRLDVMLQTYRRAPDVGLALMKRTGLFRPSADPKKR